MTTRRISHREKTKELEPYRQLCVLALMSALDHMDTRWLYLEKETRRRLADNGLDRSDLERAINDGVRLGLIDRKVLHGVPCITLREGEKSL